MNCRKLKLTLSPTNVQHHTDDIFVRHAFGNYRDILREITWNPLTAESLSFRNSKSQGFIFANNNKQVAYPDENYAREIMQLFTIGLVELNSDGTPVLDAANKTIRTYDTADVQSFSRVWTGFALQNTRANVEGYDHGNRIDPYVLLQLSWFFDVSQHKRTSFLILVQIEDCRQMARSFPKTRSLWWLHWR